MTHSTPSEENTLLIGQIVAPFGIRGQVKVRSYTDKIDHLIRRIRTVFLGEQHREYKIDHIFEHKPGLLIITFNGVTTREGAEELRGQKVAILEQQAAPLDEGEYFIHQLQGLLVVMESGEELGRVAQVLTTGANEVLVVPRQGQSDALIPMIHDVVHELDIPGGRIVISPIAGLLE